MATVKRFEDLDVWSKARALCKMVFDLTQNDLFSKDYSLKDQIRRASVSVMTNIAEGFARYSNKEFINFLVISRASAAEVKSLLYVAYDLDIINEKERDLLFEEIGILARKTNALISHLRKTAFKK